MNRFLSFAIWLALPAVAQIPFRDLAVTDDGGQIYFWSILPLKSEVESFSESMLYRYADRRLERFYTAPNTISNRPMSRWNTHVSGGGTTLIWTETTSCTGGSSCIGWPPSGVTISRLNAGEATTSMFVGGTAQISRNNRFLLIANPNSELRDLVTGQRWAVPIAPSTRDGRAVTSEGQVLGTTGRKLMLWSPSQGETQLAEVESSAPATVSDNGAMVVYARSGEILSLDVKSRRLTSLGTGTEAGVSNDGSRVLLLESGALHIVGSDGRGRRRLAPEAANIVNAKLAGFGRVAVAVTEKGQILRIDVESGEIAELIPETAVEYVSAALAPGAVLTLRGTIGRVLLIDGRPAPKIRETANEIWFQAPFELTPSDVRVRVEVDSASPFGRVLRLPIRRRAPYFVAQSGGLLAAHQGFRGLVTANDPVRPGEVVHLWAFGLGAVSPAGITAQPAAFSPLSTLVDPFDCRVLHTGEALDLRFAGLAPGLTGIYQVDLKMPEQLSPDGVFISCGTTGVEAERHGGYLWTPRN